MTWDLEEKIVNDAVAPVTSAQIEGVSFQNHHLVTFDPVMLPGKPGKSSQESPPTEVCSTKRMFYCKMLEEQISGPKSYFKLSVLLFR